jgi:uncharacterized membrane protein
MSPTTEVLLLWAGFVGSHLALSSVRVRRLLVARLGARPFQALYSLVAFAFFIPLVRVYFAHKHTGPWLWQITPGPALRGVMYVGMGLAFVLVVASQVTPSPANLVPGPPQPKPVHYLTRHPFLMGTVLFALLHLLPNGSATDVAFFGGFVVLGLVGGWHQDARKLAAGVPGYREFCTATPFLPFTGGQTWRGLRGLPPVAVGLGIALAIVVRRYHAWWFGG